MEEKKLKPKMKAEEGQSQQKLSYEQLNNICSELYQQNQNLLKQLQQANMANMFKRLDYLFLVLRYESVFKDPDFVNNCIDEIKEAMFAKQEEGTEEGN